MSKEKKGCGVARANFILYDKRYISNLAVLAVLLETETLTGQGGIPEDDI